MPEIAIYQRQDGSIDVRLEHETVWLSLMQMSALFGRDKSVVSRHLRNVFTEGELNREAVVAKFATTADDGKTYQVDHYNLDVIISVGYRVKSPEGVRFRQWASRVLKDYLVRGYALDHQRLETSGAFSTATAGSCRPTARPSSTTSASPPCRCWWPNRSRRTRKY
ncbi:MAG: virulence RhuM family protein [Sulfurimicrobium sp.]